MHTWNILEIPLSFLHHQLKHSLWHITMAIEPNMIGNYRLILIKHEMLEFPIQFSIQWRQCYRQTDIAPLIR